MVVVVAVVVVVVVVFVFVFVFVGPPLHIYLDLFINFIKSPNEIQNTGPGRCNPPLTFFFRNPRPWPSTPPAGGFLDRVQVLAGLAFAKKIRFS